eukprot:60156_1
MRDTQQEGETSTDSFKCNNFQLLTATNIMQLNMKDGSIDILGSNDSKSIKSIDSNNPSSIISYTLSALQKHCENKNISYTTVINVNQLRYKIHNRESNDKNEYYPFSQHINKLKS